MYRFGILIAILALASLLPGTAADAVQLGEAAPAFELPGVDGETHALADYADARAVVVIFTCNHCPAAKAYQDRIIQLQKDYAGKDVQVLAISSNDAKQYPADSFPNMKIRAKEKGYNFPYLYDESQAIAKAYGAKVTPHVFLLGPERTVVYRGRIDDATSAYLNKVSSKYLRDADDAVLAGDNIAEQDTLAFGCSIKWKQ